MKTTIKTGLAALVLLLAISCKKENSTIKSLFTSDQSSIQSSVAASDSSGIKIGTQIWQRKNLDLSRYRNGDRIPEVKSKAAWHNMTTGAWCYYNNDPTTYKIYGKLYNWYAVNDPRGLAPIGWHVANEADWATLQTFLGGYQVAGGKMKETGTTHWLAPNTSASNSSGFTALPGGFRIYNGNFMEIGQSGCWWTSTDALFGPWYVTTSYTAGSAYLNSFGEKILGYSVRCIKD